MMIFTHMINIDKTFKLTQDQGHRVIKVTGSKFKVKVKLWPMATVFVRFRYKIG